MNIVPEIPVIAKSYLGSNPVSVGSPLKNTDPETPEGE